MCQPKRRDARGDALEHVARREIDEALDEVEAHAFDAGRVHLLQLAVGDVFADHRDAARLVVGIDERVDQRGVVLAVAARLDDDVLVEAEIVAELKQLLLRRIDRRVFALGRIGEAARGTEDVAMRIDRARRNLEARLRRVRMERNVRRVGGLVHRVPRVGLVFSSLPLRRGKTFSALPSKIFCLSAALSEDASM